MPEPACSPEGILHRALRIGAAEGRTVRRQAPALPRSSSLSAALSKWTHARGAGRKPSIKVEDSRARESTSGIGFAVRQSDTTETEIRVDYETRAVPAAPDDFVSRVGAQSLAPRELTNTLKIPFVADRLEEGDEAFSVQLPDPVHGALEHALGQGTVTDDMLGASAGANANYQLPKEASGSDCSDHHCIFATSRGDPTIDECTVPESSDHVRFYASRGYAVTGSYIRYQTVDGTAEAGTDYVDSAAKVVFPNGFGVETLACFDISLTDDNDREGDEYFVVYFYDDNNDPFGRINNFDYTVTIEDNDNTPGIVVRNGQANENDGSMVFTVDLESAASAEVTVDYETSDGYERYREGESSATAGEDYTHTTGSVTIAVGALEASFSIPILDDTKWEPTELFTVTVSTEGSVPVAGSTARGSILEDELLPSLSISDASGSESSGSFDFNVSMTLPSAEDVIVFYYTAAIGGAQAGSDYVDIPSTRLIIPAGETTATISVQILDDQIDEGHESFELRIYGSSYADIRDGVGVGRIKDDDAAPEVSIFDGSANEDDGEITFRIALDKDSGGRVRGRFSALSETEDTAVEGEDYVAIAEGNWAIPAGKKETSVSVSVLPDALVEPDETFTATIVFVYFANRGDTEATGTIVDDDTALQLSIADTSAAESAGEMTFRVYLDGASSEGVTAQVSTADATATAGVDYSAVTGGSVTISAGDMEAFVTVSVLDDMVDESNETFTVTLTGPVNAELSDGAATGTIEDDDDMPRLSIADTSAAESAGEMTFRVYLDGASSEGVTAQVSTADATATAGVDYSAVTGGSVTISAGDMEAFITVSVLDDMIDESEETFTVTLTGPVNAELSDGVATGTIEDDDDMPRLSIADTSAAESAGEMTFRVYLDGVSSRGVTAQYSTSDATATAGSDYSAVTGGSVTISAGDTEAFVTVSVLDDMIDESEETFTVTLTGPVNAELSDGVATGTIEDDDDMPRLSIADTSAAESAGEMTFRVYLEGASSRGVTAQYSTSDATATAGSDYSAVTGGSVTISAGDTEAFITVTVLDDMVDEGNETFTVTLTGPVNAELSDGVATGTIEDDDDMPRLSIADTSAAESAGAMTFRVYLDGAGSEGVTAQVSTSDATATAGSDYSAVTGGSVTIAAGDTEAFVTVTVLDDMVDEGNETFTVTLTGPVNAELSDGVATGTIEDDDDMPRLSIADTSAVESAGEMTFRVYIDGASSQGVTAQVSTTDATATAGSDYSAVTGGSVTISAGATEAFVTVTVLDDMVNEGSETFTVTLTGPVNAELSDGVATGTIEDDDDMPRLSIADTSAAESAGAMTFRVYLDGASSEGVTAQVSTSDATATAGSDYSAVTGGSVTISAGATEAFVTVTVLDDMVDEGSETFTVTLTGPVNAELSDGVATGTIEDDDDMPRLSIADTSAAESAGEMTFRVYLDGASSEGVTAQVSTTDATATAGSDYSAVTGGSVTIPAGDMEAYVTVTVLDDMVNEGNETFTVTLTGAVNAELSDGVATGTIEDDDDVPRLSIADTSAAESAGEMTFRVYLDGASSQGVTAQVSTTDATATAGSDYSAVTGGSVTIPAGDTEAFVTVTVLDDMVDEGSETFTVTLTGPVNAELSDGVATGTIEDDDVVRVSIADSRAGELDGSAVFVVSLDRASTQRISVEYATVDATARAGLDYLAKSNTLNFDAGITEKSIAVTILADGLDEEDETFLLRLANPVNAAISRGTATGMIVDDQPRLSITGVTVGEGAGTVDLTVSLDAASVWAVTVEFATAEGTASAGQDFLAAEGTFSFLPGVIEQTITVVILEDAVYEGEETFEVMLWNATTAAIEAGVATVIIEDNDAALRLSIADVAVFEDAGAAVFTATLSSVSTVEVSASYTTLDQTAVAGEDYTATSGELQFLPGETAQTVSVAILDDAADEADETFLIRLSNAQGAVLVDREAVGRILDDQPMVNIADVSVDEDAGDAVFAVTLDAASVFEVTVGYETLDRSAVEGEDYVRATGTLIFAAGVRQRQVIVPILDDAVDEADEEMFVVHLHSATATRITDAQAIGTIRDNEDTPELAVQDIEVFEHASPAVLTVTLGSPKSDEVRVFVATSDGTAIAGSDYVALQEEVVLAPGETLQRVDIEVLEDDIVEGSEAFTVTLSGEQGAPVAQREATVTIRDNDTVAGLSIGDATVQEAAGNADFTVALSKASAQEVRVAYATAEGTATAGLDYASASDVLTFAPGETEGVISVAVLDDNLDEGNETFLVSLGTAEGATVVDGSGQGTILDDEGAPSLSLEDLTVREAAGVASVRLGVRPASGQAITVGWVLEDGTALSGQDFDGTSGTESIAAGSSKAFIDVAIHIDGFVEPDETFVVRLTEIPEGVEAGRDSAIVTIVDDDKPVVGIGDITVLEHAVAAQFSVTMDQPAYGPVTVNYASVDGTATGGEDYRPVAGILAIAAGELSAVISVPVIDDNRVEGPEVFMMILSGVVGATIDDGEGEATIQDNDEFNLSIQDVETDEDGGVAEFTVSLDVRNTAQVVSVDYASTDVTATAGLDYNARTGTLVIPAGAPWGTILVPVRDDGLHEGPETFTVTLSGAVHANIARQTATATIVDNDLRGLGIEDSRAVENAGSLTFGVRLDGASHGPVTFRYELVDATALSGSDYVAGGGSLMFLPGEMSKTIEVELIDDEIDEPEESLKLVVVEVEGAFTLNAEATGRIVDDDPESELVVSDATASEGDGEAVFAVMLGRESGWEVSVDYETVEQSAEEGRDYERVHGTLTIPAGETMGEIRVPVLEDTIAESDETFLLRLFNAQNASLARVEAVGTILGNSTRPVLDIDDVRVPESGGSAVFTVRLSGQSTQQVEVSYATADETAEAGEDYEGQRDKLIMEAGAVEATITVPVLDDALDEADEETFVVRLNSAVHADIGDMEGRGTIVDDDADLTLSINDIQVSEDARVAAFSVTLSRRSSEVVTVQFETSDASAAAPPDYTASRGIAVFEPGSSTGSVQVVIVDDALDEEEETFQVSLSKATNARIAKGVGVGTILDNDSMPQLRIDDIVALENSGWAVFRVRLSGATGRLVTVRYRTVDGTAQAGLDYEAQVGVLIFSPGSVEESVAVPLLRDGRDWREETFSVILESADHARIENAVAVATIVEEESVLEGVLGEYVARFTRAAAGHVVEALDERMRWLDSAPRCVPRVGRGLDMLSLRHVNPSWDPSAGEILSGCALGVTTETEGGAFSLWGRGAFTRYSGREGALTLQGNVTTAALGMDYRWHRGFMAGLLLARSLGSGTFTMPEQEGEASSSHTGAYPYVRYALGGSAVWALAGFGGGTAEVASAASVEASLRSRLAAVGARGRLLTAAAGRLSYRADALLVRTTADALEIRVSRLRAGLEAALTTSRIMSPYVAAGLRRDGGDAETGYGLELGGGMRLAHPSRKLRAEFSSRGLVSHAAAGFTEWGVAGSVQYGVHGGLGPATKISPSWGRARSGGLEALWRHDTVADAIYGAPGERRMEIELGYGFPLTAGTGVTRPVMAVTVRDRGKDYRLGYEVRLRKALAVSVSGIARESTSPYQQVAYGVSARAALRW